MHFARKRPLQLANAGKKSIEVALKAITSQKSNSGLHKNQITNFEKPCRQSLKSDFVFSGDYNDFSNP